MTCYLFPLQEKCYTSIGELTKGLGWTEIRAKSILVRNECVYTIHVGVGVIDVTAKKVRREAYVIESWAVPVS